MNCLRNWGLSKTRTADTRDSEIAPAKTRGGLVVLNHIGMVTGLSAAFW